MGEIKRIENIAVDKLIPYINNAKQHTEEATAVWEVSGPEAQPAPLTLARAMAVQSLVTRKLRSRPLACGHLWAGGGSLRIQKTRRRTRRGSPDILPLILRL